MTDSNDKFSKSRLGPEEFAQHRELWWHYSLQREQRNERAARYKVWAWFISVAGGLATIASTIRDYLSVRPHG